MHKLILLISAFGFLLIACGGDNKPISSFLNSTPDQAERLLTPRPTSTVGITVTIPPTTTTAGVTIISLTSPVGAGQTASLAAMTSPGARCAISYKAPAGTI